MRLVFFPFLMIALGLCVSLTLLALPGSLLGLQANAEPTREFTVVLDAGHGGEDGGTVSASGLPEKDVNLQIAKKLCEKLEEKGISVVMTRTDDRMLYDPDSRYEGRKKALDLAERRRIAEETPNSVFISIHQNSYPSPSVHGLQVWYSPNHSDSKILAQKVQTQVQTTLQPENTRQIKPATSSIYLLHNLRIPAILIECGFFSNPEEAEKLNTEAYQAELAETLCQALVAWSGKTETN